MDLDFRVFVLLWSVSKNWSFSRMYWLMFKVSSLSSNKELLIQKIIGTHSKNTNKNLIQIFAQFHDISVRVLTYL